MRLPGPLHAAVALILGIAPGCMPASSPPALQPPSAADDRGREASDGQAACDEDVPEERLARLTPIQYRHAVEDVLGEGTVPELPGAQGDAPTLLEIEALAAAAQALVARGDHLSYVPCDPQGPHDAACAEAFVRALASRAFRRPVAKEEVHALLALYAQVRDAEEIAPAASFREALDAVAEVVLQSPQLWYRFAHGPSDHSGTIRVATAYERAERLAFLLTDAPPDEALRQAAAADALLDDELLRAHAERLLETPRGKARLGRFASGWLGLDATHKQAALEALPKAASLSSPDQSPDQSPDSPELRRSMRVESEKLYAHNVVFGLDFAQLLTEPLAYVDPTLAALYGVSAPNGGEGEGWVTLDRTERAGLFTRAAFLTAHAGPERSSPIRRGVHLYRHLMCQPLGDPPPEASAAQPDPHSTLPLTTRRIAEGKTSGPSCQGCHRLVNPPGFALESYDALGRFRTHEWATTPVGLDVLAPIDSTAELAFADVRGMAEGPVALSHMLARSPTAHDCHVVTVLEDALRRPLTEADACTVATLQERFRRAPNLRTLWLDVATSAPVRQVRQGPKAVDVEGARP